MAGMDRPSDEELPLPAAGVFTVDDRDDTSDPTYSRFVHREPFLRLLHELLALPLDQSTSEDEDAKEDKLVQQMGYMLDFYLPLPTLIDPAMGSIVPPLMQSLARHLAQVTLDAKAASRSNAARLARLGRLVMWIVKVRGRKGVVTYFPPEIEHLSVLLAVLDPSTSNQTQASGANQVISDPSAWELRSLLLLWLSLLLTVPFPLKSFDPAFHSDMVSPSISSILPHTASAFPDTASAIASLSRTAHGALRVSIPLLFASGKEGEYAALILARLMGRRDVAGALDPVLAWIGREAQDGQERQAIFLTNILSFLSILPSLIPRESLGTIRTHFQDRLLPCLDGARGVAGGGEAAHNGLLRKIAVKAEGRWWVAKLGGSGGARSGDERKRRKAPALIDGDLDRLHLRQSTVQEANHDTDEDSVDLPEGIEDFIDRLMSALGDRDTIVRYSAAKYLSRLSVLLPRSMSAQIVEAVISLFAGTEDAPAVVTDKGKVLDPGGGAGPGGESRWHGICLALAEMARRGIVGEEAIGSLLPWAIRSLKFDLRRGAHSIGSNVRDAAAYLLWSLARATSPDIMRPFAVQLAQTLVTVACLDREVGVRRAASAAFQEHVGRMGLLPHGIQVLGVTDFFMVSVRRSAFLEAAPKVAQFDEYRASLVQHLHDFTLRHWDPAMRQIGAQALAAIHVQRQNSRELHASLDRELAELRSVDTDCIHGAMLALTQLAPVILSLDGDEEALHRSVQALSSVRASIFAMRGSDPMLQAACDLVASSFTTASVQDEPAMATVMRILDLSWKSRKEEVHRSAAKAIGAISQYRDCSAEVKSFVAGFRSARPPQKQSWSLALGQIQYARCKVLLGPTIVCLFKLVPPPTKTPTADVETRRNAYESITNICLQRDVSGPVVSDTDFQRCFKALLAGLGDYTTDPRGDVGAWVRTQCMTGLSELVASLKRLDLDASKQRLPEDLLLRAVQGIFKQSVEKFATVRQPSRSALVEVLQANDYPFAGRPVLTRIAESPGFFSDKPGPAFSAVAPAVTDADLRPVLMDGLIASIGSKNRDTSDAASNCLIQATLLDAESRRAVLQQLADMASTNLNHNRVFLPTLQTSTALLSGGVVKLAAEQDEIETIPLRLIALFTRGVQSMKNVERIILSLRFVIGCIPIAKLRPAACGALPIFLAHVYPRVRMIASKELADTPATTPDLTALLAEHPWSENGEAAERVVEMLRSTPQTS